MASTQLPWFTEISEGFRAGVASTFILHGDVNCLVSNPDVRDEPYTPYVSMRSFFKKIFDARELVIFYSIASGIRFLDSDMENAFRNIVGIDDKKADGADPIAAAKAGLAAKRGFPREVEACLPLIERALKKTSNVAVVLYSAHFIAPASSPTIPLPQNERINIERLRNWGQDETIRKNGNIILLLTDQAAKVSQELRQAESEIKPVFIPKPSQDERAAFIASFLEGVNKRKGIEEKLKKLKARIDRGNKGATIEEEINEFETALELLPEAFPIPKDFNGATLAYATRGMSLRQILEIFLQAARSGKEISLEFVKEKKKEILTNEYGDVMEVIEPERGFENVGGLEHVKTYFRDVLDAIQTGESRLVPQGVTLMGPPGTGKTAIGECLAKEAGFNCVRTKSIRSMWVGESEARMEKFIGGLRSLAPVVVINDEADLAEAGRDSQKGDSGVSERLMKMWMELLSDPRIRGQIVVISCTNRPDRIDPALKRSGRSDERILLPMPSSAERPTIIRVMFERHKIPTSIKDFDVFAESTEGLSGADIEKVTLTAFRFAISSKRGKEVDEEAFQEALEDFIPSASQAEIDQMTIVSLLECSSRRLLPTNVNEIVSQIARRGVVPNLEAVIQQLATRNIVPPSVWAAAVAGQN